MRLGRLPRITVGGKLLPGRLSLLAVPRGPSFRPLRTVLPGHARVVREFRELPQLEGRVAREIAP